MTTEAPHTAAGTQVRRILARKNVRAGLMFIVIAILGLWISRNYPVGTALRMGTGYMPRLLLWCLFVLGGVILLQGLREADAPAKSGSDGPAWERLRPIVFVTASLVTFGLCIERLGLVVSILLLTSIGSLANRELRFVETLLTSVALIVLSLAVFILGLDLTIPVWPDW
jgi:hypothetical protein